MVVFWQVQLPHQKVISFAQAFNLALKTRNNAILRLYF
ncbi:hypothetical protein RVIR1_13270 [Candidatus Rickettsiella viridis]|uniref:Uncharacterized protein n=1 Tax=Candidatus Rickettsiella viridis TaxID=676208 RepID=A0A2Z5UWG1_9COXI|nr:hypothetical protein RVIR1_13270 [Candidatus Rickettsiella viridis]